MRQITGYMQDYWKTLGVDIPVPGFGHLGDLFSELESLSNNAASGGPDGSRMAKT
jgi:hypothetical protein